MIAETNGKVNTAFEKCFQALKSLFIKEVKNLNAYSMVAEIGSDCKIRKGDKPGPSKACVLVGINNHDAEYGDLLCGLFDRGNPPGVPVGQYVAELVEEFEEGSMNAEMEEWRLECIEEIRASLDTLEARIKARLPFAARIEGR